MNRKKTHFRFKQPFGVESNFRNKIPLCNSSKPTLLDKDGGIRPIHKCADQDGLFGAAGLCKKTQKDLGEYK